jgi:hypothetical protein
MKMNKGVPNCPACGGKGMCDKHRVEYLEWVYKTAGDEFEAALREYKAKLEERIKQNEQGRNPS